MSLVKKLNEQERRVKGLRQANAFSKRGRNSRRNPLPSESTQKSVKVPITPLDFPCRPLSAFDLFINSFPKADPHSSIVLDAEMKTNHPQVTWSLQTSARRGTHGSVFGFGRRGEASLNSSFSSNLSSSRIIPLPPDQFAQCQRRNYAS